MIRIPYRVGLALVVAATITPGGSGADPHRFATVPALAVTAGDSRESGTVHYIVIQLDEDRQAGGPTLYFSEAVRGSAVSEEWKDGVRFAIAAAAGLLQEDARRWTVTIKNRSTGSLTEGTSASAAIAVGLMAAWRGEALQPGVVLTGRIGPDGRIGEVGGLPLKIEGASQSKMHTVLVPRGQARTAEWDLYEHAQMHRITVVEVGTLREAYEWMTGKAR
ncbi:S16 family serine protease [Candidatus Nitrospira bockiana]